MLSLHRWIKVCLLLATILTCSMVAPSATPAVQKLPPDWPEVPADLDTTGFALILGGGGARGIAHLGVIEVLEELGMRPSLIVGTSMGAVVGSLYATGWNSEQLAELALEEDILKLFMDIGAPPATMQGGWWGFPRHQVSLQINK